MPNPRTECHPHRQLSLPSRRARQQQVRKVGASDQQHQPDRSGQHQQRGGAQITYNPTLERVDKISILSR